MVVLIEDDGVLVTIALCFEKVVGPKNNRHELVGSNEFGFSIELRVLSFCLVEVLMGIPFPIDMQPPVWPRMLG